MRVDYKLYDKERELKHIPIDEWHHDSKDRPIPRIGETVVRHQDTGSKYSSGTSLRCIVTDIYHIFEEREWYSKQIDMGDSVIVALEKIKQ